MIPHNIRRLVVLGLVFNTTSAHGAQVCAMLRSLARKEQEFYPAWPSIERGLEVKRELGRCQEYYEHQLLPMSWAEVSEVKVSKTGRACIASSPRTRRRR